ncbi:MAG: putative Ig domain-containing protein, partial [Pirellulales bacterium]|nr:putative Ig domain-containing protein [Pirellulales bacterium]
MRPDRGPGNRQCRIEALEPRELLTGQITQIRSFQAWNGGIVLSTDPASIEYHAPSGHLFVADSEIEELSKPYDRGFNIFEISLAGDQVFQEYPTVDREPTGLAYNEADGYFYISNDQAKTVARWGAALNAPLLTISSLAIDPTFEDPEGIASDPAGNLYVSNGKDGLYKGVFVLNSNLEFLYKFYVGDRVSDPEGIAYNPRNRHLYIVSSPGMSIYEYTLDGGFVEQYSLANFTPAPMAPQGITFGPTSDPNDHPAALAAYIADGGKDNDKSAWFYEAVLPYYGEPPVLTTVNPLSGATEDSPFTISYSTLAAAADESDPEGDPISFRIESFTGTLTKGGSAVVPGTTLLNPGESLVWTPVNSSGLVDAFSIRARDVYNVSATAVPVRVNVLAVNDAPSFLKGANQIVNEDAGPQTVAAWATAIAPGPPDEAGQTLSFLVSTDNNALFATLPSIDAASGTLTYTPVADKSGAATVTVRLQDNGGTANGGADTSALQTFTITVNPVNDVPSFIKGPNQTVDEDAGAQMVSAWMTGISAGPTDEAAQVLSLTISADHPELFAALPQINLATGTLTFTPAANAFGAATVTLSLQDNGGTANGGQNTTVQTFTIAITPVNDPPSLGNVNTLTGGNEDTAFSISYGMLAAAADESDIEVDPIAFRIESLGSGTLTKNGAAVPPGGMLSSGEWWVWTPSADAVGELVAFTIRAWDGSANSATAVPVRVNVVPVNDAPTFTMGANHTVGEDAGAQSVSGWASGISAGPADESAQTLSFQVSTDNNGLFASLPSVNPVNGALTYTPAANQFGIATVTVQLKDNGGIAGGGADTSAARTFTITVDPVNDAPSFTKGSNQTIDEDAGLQTVVGWATGISAGPANENLQGLTFLLSVDNPGLFSAQPSINAATGTLAYTPVPDAFGSTTVTVRLKDDGGLSGGGVDTSAPQTFTITVRSVNDAPTVLNPVPDQGASKNAFLTFTFAENTFADIDGESFAYTATLQDGSPLPGWLSFSAGTRTFSGTPSQSDGNTVVIKLTATDPGGLAASDEFVLVIQTPPLLSNVDPLPGAREDTAFEISYALLAAAADESDPDGDPIAFRIESLSNGTLTYGGQAVVPGVTLLSQGGALSWTPPGNANGQMEAFTIRAWDGVVASSTAVPVYVGVAPVNDAPLFVKGADLTVNEDAAAQSIAAWATGISTGAANESGQALAFVIGVNNPTLFAAQPALDATGTLTYTLAENGFGTAVVTVQLVDDGGTADGGADTSAQQTFSITVDPVNDAPSFTRGPDLTSNEDAGKQTILNWATGISAGPANEADQTLTFVVSTNNDPLFAVLPKIDATGKLTYTAAADAFGAAQVTVSLADNGGTARGGVDASATQEFTITVNPINDPPRLANPIPDQTTSEGVAFRLTFAENTFRDVDNDPLSYAADQADGSPLPGWLSFDSATRTFSGTPGDSDGGVIFVRVTATTPDTFSTTDEFRLKINAAPSLTNVNTLTGAEEGSAFPISYELLAGAADESDPEGDPILFRIESITSGTLTKDGAEVLPGETLFSGESLVWTPSPDANGEIEAFTVRAGDGLVTSATAVPVNVSVLAVNDAPMFTPGTGQTVSEDAGPQTVSGWATGISRGPANEAAQTLGFTATTNNDGLFSALPAVDPATGDLTYTPAADAFGTATVTVSLQDGGGTDNGGVDTVAHTFTITVRPVNDAPSFTKGANLAVDEDEGAQTAAAWATGISRGPGNEADQGLAFVVSADQPGLFAAGPAIDPASGNLTYTPADNAFGTAIVTVYLQDTGGEADGGADKSAVETFAITINPVNDAPSFTKGANLSINEDAGAQTVLTWATGISRGADNESDQVLTFLVSADNPGLFAAAPTLDATGTLTYTPALDAFGTAVVTVVLEDDGGTENGGGDRSASQTFTITVNSVNDAPSFIQGADESISEDAGPQTVAGWATAILAGPPNESTQVLTFLVNTNNAGLFSAPPQIDPAGTLTYTPAANAFGAAQVTVSLKDNGGTARSGVNTSAPQTFTITVAPVNDAPTAANPIPAQVTSEGVALNYTFAENTFHDVDNDSLSYTAARADGSPLPGWLAFDPLTRTFSGTPGDSDAGVVLVRVTAEDMSAGSATADFQLKVNDPPSLSTVSTLTGGIEDTAFPISYDLLVAAADESDTEGDPLVFRIESLTSGTLTNDGVVVSAGGTLSSGQSWVWTPPTDANGELEAFTIRAWDGLITSATAVPVRVSVAAVNDVPAFTMGADHTVSEDAGAQTVTGWVTGIS